MADPTLSRRALRRRRSPPPGGAGWSPSATAGLHAARHAHERLFTALGADDVHHGDAPVGAGHVMGTCRMGTDPKTSVVDGPTRPLTIAALSLRAVEAIERSLRGG